MLVSLTLFALQVSSQGLTQKDAPAGFNTQEIRLNTFTHNRQQDTSLAADADGNILAAWGSRRQEVGTYGIYAAHLDPLGRPLGTEIHVNSTYFGHQMRPATLFTGVGEAWIAWNSTEQDTSGNGVFMRRLTLQTKTFEDGSTRQELLPLGEEIQIHQERQGDQQHVSLSRLGEEHIVAAWEDWSTTEATAKARVFNLVGEPVCDEFLLSNGTDRELSPCLATLGDGRVVAAWARAQHKDGVPLGIQGRLLNLDRTLSDVFEIDETEQPGLEPSIDADGETRFTVAFMARHQTDTENEFAAWFRLFDAQKGALTEATRVEPSGEGWITGASIAMAPDGRFMIAYSENRGTLPRTEPRRPHDDIEIQAQLFHPDGKPDGDTFTVNLHHDEEQTLQTGLNSRHAIWTQKNQIGLTWHGNLQGDRRAAGLTLLTPEEFSPPAPEVIEALAATDVHEVEVYGDEARPDWDPNWRPKPFSSNSPRGGLGGFTAFNSTGWVPPDPNLAVGQDHIVGVVNSQISFFKKDGTQTYTKSLSGSNGFWGAQGAGSFVFDPIAVYSPHHDRYVVAAAEDTNNNSYVLIAVSDDNDPNGTWHKYRVFATSCGFLDFPNLGIDEDAVYVSGDCFSGGGNNVWIFPLQPMLTGANMTPTKVNMSGSLLSLGCFKNYDSGMDAQYFASAWTSNDKILFYALEDPLGSVTKHSTTVTVSVRQSPPGADQLGTSNKADTIDNRIKHGMYRNGRLWLCHNVGAGPGGNTARVRWYEFDMRGWPTSGSQPVLIQEGTLNYGSQEHNWFGDIHVDDAGNAVIAYHRSSPTQYIEIEYVHRLASDPLGTMRAEETLQVSTRPETGNRWGDYSGVEEDPSHPGTFWNHHEYRSSSWKTWIGHFAAVQNPVLSTTALIRGWPAFLEVEFAEPNELVHFAYSVTGTGSGPCYGALGGLCLDILNPVKLAGNATSNQNGDAVCQVTVPSQAPLVPVYIQAVIMRGVNGVDSVKSNVATETIQ